MYDPANGYAVRPNRPHPSGNPADPLPKTDAQTPFYGVVPVYGCVDVGTKATQYRILDSFNGGPFLPVLNQSWWVTRLDPTGTITQYYYVTSDSAGWYDIVIPKGANPNDWEPPKLVLDWNTYQFGNGKHVLKIQLGSGAATVSDCIAGLHRNTRVGAAAAGSAIQRIGDPLCAGRCSERL